MTVSIVIPVYNEEATIRSCLQSLARQTINSEVIIIDDGSTDKTTKILSELQILNFKFQTISEMHRGPGAARNAGVKRAKGEIVVFVDADMTCSSNFIEKLIEPIEKKSAIGTFTKEEYVSNWDNVWARCWNYNNNLSSSKRIPSDYPDTSPVFRAILKKEFVKVGGFTEGIGWTDDWSLSRKLKIKAVAANALCYHSNPSSLMEIYLHARWIGKNEYITGSLLRKVYYLFYHSALLSIYFGIKKAISYLTIEFFVFKLVYDFSITFSIWESFVSQDRNK